jgi:predicted metal-dependent peptidase
MRIRGEHPFLGALALVAELRVTENVATAATDGRMLFFNPEFVDSLNPNQLCGLVVHELLHAALQHVPRRRERVPRWWNVASDVVVNGMIRNSTSYDLPRGGVEDSELAHLSVEEIYEQFSSGKRTAPTIDLIDLLIGRYGGNGDGNAQRLFGFDEGWLETSEAAHLQQLWRSALQQAWSVARRINRGFGIGGLGIHRDFEAATHPQLSWRELLWEFMVTTPSDFGGFDRRFVHRGLYLEELVGQTLDVAICIDTSASIRDRELSAFRVEVQGILDAYPQIEGRLFYADAGLDGPYKFSLHSMLPTAKGGGGTSFVPFFDWVQLQELNGARPLCIYFTDGWGHFPSVPPTSPVLWVVTPGGLPTPSFPFGQVAKMLD